MNEIFFVLLILVNNSMGQSRSTLFKKVEEAPGEKPKITKQKINNAKTDKTEASGGNLPTYYLNKPFFAAEASPIVLPSSRQQPKLDAFKVGELFNAEISESLLAFNDSRTAVRAKVKLQNNTDVILLGEASLEKNTKRIYIDFKKLRRPNDNQIWSIQASALDQKGFTGIEGKLYINEDKYFIAQFLSASAAGFSDASINRTQNALGNNVEDKSLDTLGKKALTNALSKTTDLFAEKLKTAPEYSLIEGPIQIQILVTDTTKLIE